MAATATLQLTFTALRWSKIS